MPRLEFKRGGTFAATCTYTPPAGGLANLIGADITSQLRSAGALVADLGAATVAADGLSFTFAAVNDTSAWPTGPVQWDIRIAIGGQVVYSETVEVYVANNITR